MSAKENNKTTIGVLLLAAGSSSRLGRPKQLLEYNGQTLLQHSLQAVRSSNVYRIVVVVGAKAEIIKRHVEAADVHVVENRAWQEGMASSIRCGVIAFTEIIPDAEGVILMVCDQPFVTASLLNELIAVHQNSGKLIVTCSYAGTFGPPTLFHKRLFGELLRLTGDTGARSILRQQANDVEVVLFPEGTQDIDTEAEYEQIKSKDAL
jgi:molybdenum cofactor cytidylyltransferase